MTKLSIKNGELWLGDCLALMADIPSASIDMILCDLPYGTTQCAWDSLIDLPYLWGEYNRICRGPVVLFAQTPFDKVLGSSNLASLRYEWIWEKTNATGHLNAKRAPMKAHENILIFYRSSPTYNPQMTHGHERVKTIRKTNTSPVYGEQTSTTYSSTSRYPRSVQVFPSDKRNVKFHDTQKPVDLFEYLIKTYSNPGDMILDNCSGSGTTAVAAERSDRRWLCIEKDETYFWNSVARLVGGDK